MEFELEELATTATEDDTSAEHAAATSRTVAVFERKRPARQWMVIQHVREKTTCRDCETISEPSAPFHVTPRGWAGPSLLAIL